MDREGVAALLADVANGTTTPAAALDVLAAPPLTEGVALGPGLRVDTHRALRTGNPEAVYAAGKTADQTLAAVAALLAAGGPALVTRADVDTLGAIGRAHPGARLEPACGGALVGQPPLARGLVLVVAAGTSDGPVATEAELAVVATGAQVRRIDDVGVAGLHRLLAVSAELAGADALVVVAGMDGALPTAVAGLVPVPVIAVPTSVGYGAAFSGLAPLLTMLNACAPGVVVVNIDNGYGAGLFAARVARAAAGPGTAAASGAAQ